MRKCCCTFIATPAKLQTQQAGHGMAGWFKRFTHLDGIWSLGEWVWAVCKFLGLPAVMVAGAAAATQWYWDAYGLIGVAFAFLVALIVIPISAALLAGGALIAANARNTWLGKGDSSPAGGMTIDIEDRISKSTLANEINNMLIITRSEVSENLAHTSGEINRIERQLEKCTVEINRLSGRLKEVDSLLQPNPMQVGLLSSLTGESSTSAKNIFESLKREIDSVRDHGSGARDALMHITKETQGKIDSLHVQISNNYSILATAIRARDARAIIKDADAVVIEKGEKLMKAGNYENDKDWHDDYKLWYEKLSIIDRLLLQWSDHHTPYLNISHSDYDGVGFSAPPIILQFGDQNGVRYKNVWIAQTRYTNQRDNVFAYFNSKASELPG